MLCRWRVGNALPSQRNSWVEKLGVEGWQCPRFPEAFSVKECGVVVELLTIPSLAVIEIFVVGYTEPTAAIDKGAELLR